MTMKRCLLVVIALLLVSTLALTGCTSKTTAPKTLKVGILADLSGFLSVFYIEATHDLQLTADYINEKGGVTIQGQKYNIELVIRDSKSSPDGALAAANQLIFQDQVKYAIGPIAFEGAATTPLFEQNKILHIFNTTTTSHLEIGPDWPYAFTGDDSALDFSTVLFKIGKKEFPNAKTCVMILPDDGTEPYLMPSVTPILQSMGYTILNGGKAVLYPNDMQDFSPVVSKLNSINPDIMFQPEAAPPAVYGILGGIRALGNKVVYMPTLFPGDPNNVIAAVGPDAATNFAFLNYTKDDPGYGPILKELIKRLKPDAPFFTFTLGNCLMVLTNVMEKANSLDVEKIKAKWESLDTIDSVYGTGKVGGLKTFGRRCSVTWPEPYNMTMDGKVIKNLPWIDPGPTP
jgi:branched-chain amino acid transport system substrate-binding protein